MVSSCTLQATELFRVESKAHLEGHYSDDIRGK